jgi:hypothetical protein
VFRAALTSNHREFDMTNATHPFDALMEIAARPRAVFVRGEGSFCGTIAASAISILSRDGL